jgi:ComF family protein
VAGSPKLLPAKAGSLSALFVSGCNHLAAALFTTLFPADCRICAAPLINVSRLPVCDDCLSAIRPIAGGLCAICGERLVSPYAFSSADHEPICGLCRRSGPPFIKATAYGSYEGGLRDLIHLLKYNGVRPAANVLGRMLAEAISHLDTVMPHALIDDRVIVIPVPLHKKKRRAREFNQAETIARIALKLLGNDRFHLSPSLLERTRETQSQIGLSRHQRRENMRGAFAVPQTEAARAEIKDQPVLIVDDVFTTGTTVSECARILRRAGASKVYVATGARTLKLEAQLAQLPAAPEEAAAALAAGA